MCRVNTFRIAIPIEILCAVDKSAIVVAVLLGSVTMHDTHVRMDHDIDPLSFDGRVKATRLMILILVDCNLDRDSAFLLCVNGV